MKATGDHWVQLQLTSEILLCKFTKKWVYETFKGLRCIHKDYAVEAELGPEIWENGRRGMRGKVRPIKGTPFWQVQKQRGGWAKVYKINMAKVAAKP